MDEEVSRGRSENQTKLELTITASLGWTQEVKVSVRIREMSSNFSNAPRTLRTRVGSYTALPERMESKRRKKSQARRSVGGLGTLGRRPQNHRW
jgi:hypothetical protein